MYNGKNPKAERENGEKSGHITSAFAIGYGDATHFTIYYAQIGTGDDYGDTDVDVLYSASTLTVSDYVETIW